MPRAKQQDRVEVEQGDAAATVQVNGTRPRRSTSTTDEQAGTVKRTGTAGTKETSDVKEAPKDADTGNEHSAKAQKAKHPKAASAPRAPEHHGATRKHEAVAFQEEPTDLFLEHQRELLKAERNNYTRQAAELRAQAEALALEHEPGDVQFDEEGGEGGTANVDRELDLHLSAQAQAAVEEIDAALAKIAAGTYGFCESCGNPVPGARLEALPHARLCVSCKSGGLSVRRQ
jgi:DnaK suppressor protein